MKLLTWFSVVSLPGFFLALFAGLGFPPLQTSHDSPIRWVSQLFAAVFLFGGPLATAYMIRWNVVRNRMPELVVLALPATGWAIIAYCLIGGIMGIH